MQYRNMGYSSPSDYDCPSVSLWSFDRKRLQTSSLFQREMYFKDFNSSLFCTIYIHSNEAVVALEMPFNIGVFQGVINGIPLCRVVVV
ncbi:MAG: hypothetical protein ACI93R_003000 [Flavobacteriales bacterium]|jgi:hypothetical protein